MRRTSTEYGTRRTKTWFALLPVYVYLGKGSHERRWLERVTVHQVFCEGGHWFNEAFVDRATSGKEVAP